MLSVHCSTDASWSPRILALLQVLLLPLTREAAGSWPTRRSIGEASWSPRILALLLGSLLPPPERRGSWPTRRSIEEGSSPRRPALPLTREAAGSRPRDDRSERDRVATNTGSPQQLLLPPPERRQDRGRRDDRSERTGPRILALPGAPWPAHPRGGDVPTDDRSEGSWSPRRPAPPHPRGGRIVAKERNRNYAGRCVRRSPATTVEVALQKANPRPLAGAGGISHLPASPTAAAPAARASAAIHSGAPVPREPHSM